MSSSTTSLSSSSPAGLSPGRHTLWAYLGANSAAFLLWRLDRRRFPGVAKALHGHGLCSRVHLLHGRFHTLLTSTMSHQKPLHFAVNIYGLALFGGAAAEQLESKELGVLLVTCGVGASGSHALLHPKTPVMGASGVLMGLLTADSLLQPERQYKMLLPIPGLTLTTLQVSDLALVANLFGFLVLRPWLPTCAWAAHLGGTFAGLGFACISRRCCGDASRFKDPVRLHVEQTAKDWERTAESMEDGLDRVFGRWT